MFKKSAMQCDRFYSTSTTKLRHPYYILHSSIHLAAMRSLRLLSHYATTFAPDASSEQLLVKITHDPETGDIYLAYADPKLVRLVKLNVNQKLITEIVSFPVNIEHTPGVPAIVGIRFLLDAQAVCLVLGNGDIVLVRKELPDYAEKFEIVGSVDAGIRAMSWSPDEETVVMVTGTETVLEMTKEFDVITEFPVNVEEIGEDVSVNVGWGRKETQFHGSEGKQAAQKKVDMQSLNFSEDDDQLARVSWRGDGSLFACSAVDPAKGRRIIRVYNREGILQNTSEPVDKLEHVLDWRPSGNLIAASQRLAHRHDIVFFEKNGLRHGEFTLREPRLHKVIDILWNADSTVLAVWIARQDETGAFRNSVQLWTMNNYHWYIKQEIDTAAHEMGDVVGFQWDLEKPLRAHVATRSGWYQTYDYCWDTFISSFISEENAAYAAVVDGASVLLTPFRFSNVPPPMSSTSVSVPSGCVVDVAFGPTHGGNDCVALASDGYVSFFESTKVKLPFSAPMCLGTIKLPHWPNHGAPRHVAWIDASTLLYVCHQDATSGDAVIRLNLQLDGTKIVGSSHVVSKPLFECLVRLYANPTHGDVLVETTEGHVLEVHSFDDEIIVTPTLTLPEMCPWIETTRVGPNRDSRETVIIGLNERNKLYANTGLVASDCTSFFVHHNYLVFTTSNHTARFLPLNASLADFKVVDNTALPYDEAMRRVERGSKVVLAVHYATNLILQMPRGNLETIYPRALVLSSIRDAIDRYDYRIAFIYCRKHRVDFNILFDHAPSSFLDNIDSFVRQLQDVDFLNLFLSSLRNEDVTITMYPFGAKSSTAKSHGLQSKVNTICDAIRAVLQKLDVKYYIQSILSTYALKFTIFLCDADRLYNIALGMYDFNLVLMVAQQSQKDPREYLPFLQELQNLETFYQRFKIDDHLQRFEKALLNLSLAGDQYFDQTIKYMQKHHLYQTALRAYGGKLDRTKIILGHYGDHLMEKSSYSEAGIVYAMASDHQKALDAYRLAGEWRMVFALATQLQYSAGNITALAEELIGFLQDKRLYQDASVVAVDYAKDVESAVDSLVKGYFWTEAVRLLIIHYKCHTYLYNFGETFVQSNLHGRGDLIQTNVIPGLIDGFNQITEDISEMSDQFIKQTERLREIRTKKPETSKESGPIDDSLDNIDMFSDTTSMASQFTRYTQTTSRVSTMSTKSGSKTRRREERKRARGKKGSVFEEEYLVNSLKRLIQRANNIQSDVGNLLRALVTYGIIDKARTIQASFDDLLAKLRASIDEIFVPLQLALNEPNPDLDDTLAHVAPSAPTEKPVISDVEWKLPVLELWTF
ncbi:IKI3 family-domain-containing protein [Endogone sp. FLAS-F59071]|nr:IKI3 family-domain-containing protein [Endogone sp. FLAS-F59071]|eukprot:RUS18247.1 IKI3 family-domain-containing protein [Endogone sp. FLAS-F59071]